MKHKESFIIGHLLMPRFLSLEGRDVNYRERIEAQLNVVCLAVFHSQRLRSSLLTP